MEAVTIPSSPEQSISPYRQIRNPSRRNNRRFTSKPSENVSPTKNIQGGLLLAPPPSLSSSFNSSALLLNHQHQQPPLLPLPAPKTYASLLPSRSPQVNKKNNIRDQSLTPKKSKPPPSSSPKKEETRSTVKSDGSLMVASTNRLGPDPRDLPKKAVSRILTSGNTVIGDLDKFSGSVFILSSPPPSSLPLPKFSLRPKLGCNAEAAEIDAGATDNLRRLLRLR